MKYFGEYLVEKKIVSAENLVQAVLHQNQNQPLAAQIAYEKQIFSAEEMIKIFSSQQDNQLDFFAAGFATGLLTDDRKLRLENELQQHHLPLSGLLLKNGAIGVKDLVHALDEFLSTAKPPSNTQSAKVVSASNNPSASTFPQLEFPNIEQSFRLEIQSTLSKSKVLEAINILQLVKQNASVKELVQEFLQDVLRTVHTIRGLAKAANAPLLEQMFTLMDATIVKELRSELPNTEYITNVLTPTIEKGFLLCETIANSLATNPTEESFWNVVENQAQFRSIFANLEK